MGKVLVLGKAEKKIAPDSCDITITIESRKNTSAAALKEASVLCEQLLSKIQHIGLDLKKIDISHDSLSFESDYRSDKKYYQALKRILIHTSSDTSSINTIKSIMEEGVNGISYHLRYSIADEADIRKQLMKEAIMDSRRKADFLAESTGNRIIGVDSANLTENEDVYDVSKDDEMEDWCEHERVVPCCAAGSAYPLSDNLKPEEIELEAQVRIVWLLSSD